MNTNTYTVDNNTGRYEQQPVGYNQTTGLHTDTRTTGTSADTHTGFAGESAPGTNYHNTHNPLTGDGVNNTHNPFTGDKTGPHPPPGTNPITGRTNDGNLGRNEQQSQAAGYLGTTSTIGVGPHDHTTDNTARERGVNPTSASGMTSSGPHSTSTKTSGGGAKAVFGRVEATLGAMINNSEMYSKGVQKQEEAQAAKRAKQEAMHGGATIRH